VNRATEYKNVAMQNIFAITVKRIKLIYVIPRIWQIALHQLYRVNHNSMAHFIKSIHLKGGGGKNLTRDLQIERETLQVSSAQFTSSLRLIFMWQDRHPAADDQFHPTPAEALRYKPEGRGFVSRCCHWNFSLIFSFRPHYGPGVDSASNRNEYQEYFLVVKAAGA
jgi:hypothetical protein